MSKLVFLFCFWFFFGIVKSQGVEEGSFVCDGAVNSISVVPTKLTFLHIHVAF